MANTVNTFLFATEDLATYLAKPVSDGTNVDLVQTLKVDEVGKEALASQIFEAAGELYGNTLDDFVLAAYPLIREVATGLFAGDITLNTASPTLTVGNGGGSPGFVIDKIDAGTATLTYQNGGVQSWEWTHDASENLILARAGDTAVLTLTQSSGLATWAANMSLISTSPVLEMGDASGSGSPILRLRKANVGTSKIFFKQDATDSWELRHDGSNRLIIAKASGVEVLFLDQATSLATWKGSTTWASASPTLTVGDASGSPSVVLNKDGGSLGLLKFQNESVTQWQLYQSSDEELYIARSGGVTVMKFTQSTGLATFANSVILDSASPTLTVGDGSGSPSLLINKSETGNGQLKFEKLGAQSWTLLNDNTENFQISRAGGVQVLTFFQSTGLSKFFGDITIQPSGGSPVLVMDKSEAGTGALIFRKLGGQSWAFTNNASENLVLAKGAAASVLEINQTTGGGLWFADWKLNSASPDLTTGDGTGAPRMLLNKSETGTSQFIFQKLGIQSWSFANNSVEDLLISRAGAVNVMTLTQSSGKARFHEDFDVNGTTINFNDAGVNLTLGSGAGSPDLLLNKSEAGVSAVKFLKLGSQSWAVANTATENLAFQKVGGSNVFELFQADSSGRFYANLLVSGDLEIDGAFNHDGTTFGAMGATPVTRPSITVDNSTQLLAALVALGLVTDDT